MKYNILFFVQTTSPVNYLVFLYSFGGILAETKFNKKYFLFPLAC